MPLRNIGEGSEPQGSVTRPFTGQSLTTRQVESLHFSTPIASLTGVRELMILKTTVSDRNGWTLYQSDEQCPLPRYHPTPRKPMAERVLAYPRLPHYPITRPITARVTRRTDRIIAVLLCAALLLLMMVW